MKRCLDPSTLLGSDASWVIREWSSTEHLVIDRLTTWEGNVWGSTVMRRSITLIKFQRATSHLRYILMMYRPSPLLEIGSSRPNWRSIITVDELHHDLGREHVGKLQSLFLFKIQYYSHYVPNGYTSSKLSTPRNVHTLYFTEDAPVSVGKQQSSGKLSHLLGRGRGRERVGEVQLCMRRSIVTVLTFSWRPEDL